EDCGAREAGDSDCHHHHVAVAIAVDVAVAVAEHSSLDTTVQYLASETAGDGDADGNGNGNASVDGTANAAPGENANHYADLRGPRNAAAHEATAAAHGHKATRSRKPAEEPVAAAPVSPPPLTTAPQIDEAGARAHYSSGVALIRDRKYDEALDELNQSLVI